MTSPDAVDATPLLQVEQVAAGYGLMPVLHGLSIEVRRAEIVAQNATERQHRASALLSKRNPSFPSALDPKFLAQVDGSRLEVDAPALHPPRILTRLLQSCHCSNCTRATDGPWQR